MENITEIKAVVGTELQDFRKAFRTSVKTKVPLLNAVNRYILRKKGKELRPVVVLLAAKACGNVTAQSYTAATLVELFHTATLVHDDVVDEAKLRRGIFSINAIWKSKVAVLVGDFLLSRSMLTALENKAFRLLEIVSTAVKEISEGELLQLEKSKKYTTTEEEYLTIIQQKTAALFAACAEMGAASATENEEEQEALRQYGLYLGMAFQMQDDLLDFDKTNRLGKSLYNDLQERKMTLPIIYALAQSKDAKKQIKIFKKKKKKRAELEQLAQFIVENGGATYTQKCMENYREKAAKCLAILPKTEAREALLALADFAVRRKK